MKRILTLILTVLMLCTLLFGCGQKSEDGDPQDTNTEPALADGVYTADFNTCLLYTSPSPRDTR